MAATVTRTKPIARPNDRPIASITPAQWRQEVLDAGLGEPGHCLDQPGLGPSEALPQLPTLDERRVTVAAYVNWGDHITDQLARYGLVQFRAFKH